MFMFKQLICARSLLVIAEVDTARDSSLADTQLRVLAADSFKCGLQAR